MTILIISIIAGTIVGIGILAGKRACPHCRSNIDAKAIICPQCKNEIVDDEVTRYDIKKRDQNYALGGLAIGAVLVGLVLYSSGGKENVRTTEKATSRSTAQPSQSDKARCVVFSIDSKVTEQNSVWWKYAWKATLKNNSESAISTDVTVKFLDKDGFVIDEDREYNVVVPAGSEKLVSEHALIDASVAANVKSVSAITN
jgi:hypothetical protein